jgi:hypothetical protein
MIEALARVAGAQVQDPHARADTGATRDQDRPQKLLAKRRIDRRGQTGEGPDRDDAVEDARDDLGGHERAEDTDSQPAQHATPPGAHGSTRRSHAQILSLLVRWALF